MFLVRAMIHRTRKTRITEANRDEEREANVARNPLAGKDALIRPSIPPALVR